MTVNFADIFTKLCSMILWLLSKMLHIYVEFLWYRNTYIFPLKPVFDWYQNKWTFLCAHWVILVLTLQSKFNHLAVSRVRNTELYLKYTFLGAFLWSIDTRIIFFDKENCSFKLSNYLHCFYMAVVMRVLRGFQHDCCDEGIKGISTWLLWWGY